MINGKKERSILLWRFAYIYIYVCGHLEESKTNGFFFKMNIFGAI